MLIRLPKYKGSQKSGTSENLSDPPKINVVFMYMLKLMQGSLALRQTHLSLLHFLQLQIIVNSSVIDLMSLIGSNS